MNRANFQSTQYVVTAAKGKNASSPLWLAGIIASRTASSSTPERSSSSATSSSNCPLGIRIALHQSSVAEPGRCVRPFISAELTSPDASLSPGLLARPVALSRIISISSMISSWRRTLHCRAILEVSWSRCFTAPSRCRIRRRFSTINEVYTIS